MILKKGEMSIGRLITSVFLPATIMLLLYISALNLRETISPLLSWILIGIFVLLPFELYVILCASKKEYGKYSLKSALTYNNKITPRKLLLKAIILFCIAGAVATLVGNIETQFMTSTVLNLC